MRLFFEKWHDYVNRQPIADDLEVDGKMLFVEICQPVADEIN